VKGVGGMLHPRPMPRGGVDATSSVRPTSQTGSAAVTGTVMVAVLAVVAVFVAAVGGAVADQRRVEAAADLGALAAAAAVQMGRPACAAAGTVVRRNGARLGSCVGSGEVVTVRALRDTRPLLGRTFQVSSTARAGPVGLGP
jgi:secretion/DNA translocation related TadE-like protein